MTRCWRPGRPVPVLTIWATLRRGAGDPAFILDRAVVWRSLRTPEGAATLQVETRAAGAEVHARSWGPGAVWTLDRLPQMLGDDDVGAGDFRGDTFGNGLGCGDSFLRGAIRRHPHWRVPRTDLVFEALLAAVLEQKVTGQEAWAGWRALLRGFGEPAPGPGAERGLWVTPTPATVAAIPSWEWLRLPVDPARSRTAVLAARLATSLERTVGLPATEVERRLCSLQGVGRWTAAEVRQRAHGDADAVSFGDLHVPADIGHTLTGRPVDDAGLAALLAPYRPHRYRVQRLVELCGARTPRRGPRMAPRRHLPTRYR
ncbi:MAG: DNA-3-methyladenine glycosylase 2 family protein [Nocardioidaceae bacterium]|nr:DNA-3-methyladenine glycosylase 2 family protein [Nocardioidaceae bacterium]